MLTLITAEVRSPEQPLVRMETVAIQNYRSFVPIGNAEGMSSRRTNLQFRTPFFLLLSPGDLFFIYVRRTALVLASPMTD